MMLLATLAAVDAMGEQRDDEDEAKWSLHSGYTGELWYARNGDETSHNVYLDNFDIVFDATEPWGLDDTRIHAYGLYNNGSSLSESSVGDLQVISNIETGVQAFRLYEAWIESGVGNDASLLFGLYDLNSEFDALDTASLFINSAHGIGSEIGLTGNNGPSIFPVTSLAARLLWEPAGDWAFRVAALDGVPGDPNDPEATRVQLGGGDGVLLIAEGERRFGIAKLLAGSWAYSAEFDRWDDASARSTGNAGVYLRGESAIVSDEAGVSLFGRIGWANPQFNIVDLFASFGMTWTGLLPGRPDDTLGLAIAHARAGRHYRRSAAGGGAVSARAETNYELTWHVPLTGRLSVQPDIQYIANPGLDPDRDHAWAFGLRMVWEKEW